MVPISRGGVWFWIALFFLINTLPCQGQSFELWQKAQRQELRLSAPYQRAQKWVYSGKKDHEGFLEEEKWGENGLLIKEQFSDHLGNLIYEVQFKHKSNNQVELFNASDSSLAVYYLDSLGNMRSYIAQQGFAYIIYTYAEDGALIKCKDCMPRHQETAPTCFVYDYVYDSTNSNRLAQINEYTILKFPKKDDANIPKLIYIDSLVYNDNKQLIGRHIITGTSHTTIKKHRYIYNRKGQLRQETSAFVYAPEKATHKHYVYYKNGLIKKKLRSNFEMERESWYNSNGLPKRQRLYTYHEGQKWLEQRILFKYVYP